MINHLDVRSSSIIQDIYNGRYQYQHHQSLHGWPTIWPVIRFRPPVLDLPCTIDIDSTMYVTIRSTTEDKRKRTISIDRSASQCNIIDSVRAFRFSRKRKVEVIVKDKNWYSQNSTSPPMYPPADVRHAIHGFRLPPTPRRRPPAPTSFPPVRLFLPSFLPSRVVVQARPSRSCTACHVPVEDPASIAIRPFDYSDKDHHI